jgi:hypothetical protein
MDHSRCFDHRNGFKTNRVKSKFLILLHFILAMILNTYVPQTAMVAPYLVAMAKNRTYYHLVLIGAGLSHTALKAVGTRPLVQGVFGMYNSRTLLSILYFI